MHAAAALDDLPRNFVDLPGLLDGVGGRYMAAVGGSVDIDVGALLDVVSGLGNATTTGPSHFARGVLIRSV